jgi:hypothetical protein
MGPRGPFTRRSTSRAPAMFWASGFSSMTELTDGPEASISAIRFRYFLTKDADVSRPELIASCNSAMVASSNE